MAPKDISSCDIVTLVVSPPDGSGSPTIIVPFVARTVSDNDVMVILSTVTIVVPPFTGHV